MKIWFDQAFYPQLVTSHANQRGGGCSPDDSCGCDGEDSRGNYSLADLLPARHLAIDLSPQEFDAALNHVLVWSPALYVQPYQDDHWIICTPTGRDDYLAVLDGEAYALLQRFHQPGLLQDLSEFAQNKFITQVVAFLLHLGFLCDLMQPVPSVPEVTSQTLSAWLHLTNACNLRCSYCYVSKTTEHMADDIAKESVDALIRSALAYDYRA